VKQKYRLFKLQELFFRGVWFSTFSPSQIRSEKIVVQTLFFPIKQKVDYFRSRQDSSIFFVNVKRTNIELPDTNPKIIDSQFDRYATCHSPSSTEFVFVAVSH
jgi:hypothetical protein